MPQLSQTFYLAEEHQPKARQLLEQTRHYTRHFLQTHYWTDKHLQEYTNENPIKPYKYFTSLELDPFENHPDYVYNRYKRCVYNKLGDIFEAHKDEYQAFNFVTSIVEETHIRRIATQKLKHELDNSDTYVNWQSVKSVIDKLNSYYSTNGEFPDDYTTLVSTPHPNGTLSYSADEESIHTLEYQPEAQTLSFSFKHPDSTASSIDSYHDWEETRDDFHTFNRFEHIVGENASLIGKPTLREENENIVIDVPVEVEPINSETESERVVSCDLGVKTQVTTTISEHSHKHDSQHEHDGEDGESEYHSQITTPEFVNHHAKDKLFRLLDERERVLATRDKLVEQNGVSDQQKATIVEEAEQVKNRVINLREQMQHDIANWLVLYALEHNASTIAFENLDSLEAPSGRGKTSRSISSWARGELVDRVRYKASLVGIEVETVNPWGTSRYCPRCGERGETVRAPDNRKREDSGGWFVCKRCGFEGDRDYVGALNVGRMVFTSEWKIGLAKPVAYIEAGNYASFSSPLAGEFRFAGVRQDGDESRDSDTICVGSKDCHQSKKDTGVIASWSRFARSSVTRIVLNHTKN